MKRLSAFQLFKRGVYLLKGEYPYNAKIQIVMEIGGRPGASAVTEASPITEKMA